ncbi:MAG: cobalamin B12-binding domain-containing protein [Chloroflexi bacterium]|nr:cobalamin B12-binding domain-containing protein [Chloroflexota bacterium]
MKPERNTIRVLVAKPGLDGHDRGAKVIVKTLMDAGMEVIYTGRHQRVDQVVSAAIQEDVDVIGLSILSGAHLFYTDRLMGMLKEEGMADKVVVVGGNIPKTDVPKLKEMGVAEVFSTGTPLARPVEFLRGKFGLSPEGERATRRHLQ